MKWDAKEGRYGGAGPPSVREPYNGREPSST